MLKIPISFLFFFAEVDKQTSLSTYAKSSHGVRSTDALCAFVGSTKVVDVNQPLSSMANELSQSQVLYIPCFFCI
jgi:hypothetical protein